MASGELKEIGNLIKLRETIDQNFRATNHIRSGLSVVDIIPTWYRLSLSNIGKGDGSLGIKFDDSKGIENYHQVLSAYGLHLCDGLRLYTTDETTTQDEVSHNFDDNIIEGGLNSLSGHAKSLRQIVQSISPDIGELFQGTNKIKQNAMSRVKSALSMLGIDEEQPIIDAMGDVGKVATNIVLK